jgi:GTP pyrophosphokinase
VYGDAIVGFIVNRKAVEVHRAGCAGAVSPLDSWRAVEVSWEGRNTGVVVEVRVDAIDRDGLLADVARTFSTLEAQIVSSSTAIGRDMIARERFSIRLADLTQLDIVLEALLKVDGVYSAWRS